MSRIPGVLIGLGLALGAGHACADDPCAAATWEHERALFRQAPQVINAGVSAAQLPVLKPDVHYEVNLSAQPQVAFALAPAKKKEVPGSRAGLAQLTLEHAGVYRISLSAPVWVDVIANGTLLESRDHQGRHGCDAPQKIVEFTLPAGTALTLQLSASSGASVDVAITPAPAPTPA